MGRCGIEFGHALRLADGAKLRGIAMRLVLRLQQQIQHRRLVGGFDEIADIAARPGVQEFGEGIVRFHDPPIGLGDGNTDRRVAENGCGKLRRNRRGGALRRNLMHHQTRREPPRRRAVGQRTHRGGDLNPATDGEGFFALFAIGGALGEAVQRGGGRLVSQRQFRRRRRIAFGRAGHAAIDVVAVDNRAVRARHRPGDIGARGGFGDEPGFIGAHRFARPDRI